jgi:hypothetical protein
MTWEEHRDQSRRAFNAQVKAHWGRSPEEMNKAMPPKPLFTVNGHNFNGPVYLVIVTLIVLGIAAWSLT